MRHWRNWFRSAIKRPKPSYSASFEAKLGLRKLEPRRVLSVSADLFQGDLRIDLSEGDDGVLLELDSSSGTEMLEVKDHADPDQTIRSVALSEIGRIVINDTSSGNQAGQFAEFTGTSDESNVHSISLQLQNIERLSIRANYIDDVTVNSTNTFFMEDIAAASLSVTSEGSIVDADGAQIKIDEQATFIAGGDIEVADYATEESMDSFEVGGSAFFSAKDPGTEPSDPNTEIHAGDYEIRIGANAENPIDSGAYVSFGSVGLVADRAFLFEDANTHLDGIQANSLEVQTRSRISQSGEDTGAGTGAILVTGETFFDFSADDPKDVYLARASDLAEAEFNTGNVVDNYFGVFSFGGTNTDFRDFHIRNTSSVEFDTLPVFKLGFPSHFRNLEFWYTNDSFELPAIVDQAPLVVQEQLTIVVGVEIENRNESIDGVLINDIRDAGATLTVTDPEATNPYATITAAAGSRLTAGTAILVAANDIDLTGNAELLVGQETPRGPAGFHSLQGDVSVGTNGNDADDVSVARLDGVAATGRNVTISEDDSIHLVASGIDSLSNVGISAENLVLLAEGTIKQDSDAPIIGFVTPDSSNAQFSISRPMPNPTDPVDPVDSLDPTGFELLADNQIDDATFDVSDFLVDDLPDDLIPSLRYKSITEDASAHITSNSETSANVEFNELILWFPHASINLRAGDFGGGVLTVYDRAIFLAGVDGDFEQGAFTVSPGDDRVISDDADFQLHVGMNGEGTAKGVASGSIELADEEDNELKVADSAFFRSLNTMSISVGVQNGDEIEALVDSGADVQFGSLGIMGGTTRIFEDADTHLDGVNVTELGLSTESTISQSGRAGMADSGDVIVSGNTYLELRDQPENGADFANHIYLARITLDPLDESTINHGALLDNEFGGTLTIVTPNSNVLGNVHLRNTSPTGQQPIFNSGTTTAFQNLELWYTHASLEIDGALSVSNDLTLVAGLEVTNRTTAALFLDNADNTTPMDAIASVINQISQHQAELGRSEPTATDVDDSSISITDEDGTSISVTVDAIFAAADEIVLANYTTDTLNVGGNAFYKTFDADQPGRISVGEGGVEKNGATVHHGSVRFQGGHTTIIEDGTIRLADTDDNLLNNGNHTATHLRLWAQSTTTEPISIIDYDPAPVETNRDEAGTTLQVTYDATFRSAGFIQLATRANDEFQVAGDASFMFAPNATLDVGVIPVDEPTDSNRGNASGAHVEFGGLNFRPNSTNDGSMDDGSVDDDSGHVTIFEGNGDALPENVETELFGENRAKSVVLLSQGSISDRDETLISIADFALFESGAAIQLADYVGDRLDVRGISSFVAMGNVDIGRQVAIDEQPEIDHQIDSGATVELRRVHFRAADVTIIEDSSLVLSENDYRPTAQELIGGSIVLIAKSPQTGAVSEQLGTITDEGTSGVNLTADEALLIADNRILLADNRNDSLQIARHASFITENGNNIDVGVTGTEVSANTPGPSSGATVRIGTVRFNAVSGPNQGDVRLFETDSTTFLGRTEARSIVVTSDESILDESDTEIEIVDFAFLFAGGDIQLADSSDATNDGGRFVVGGLAGFYAEGDDNGDPDGNINIGNRIGQPASDSGATVRFESLNFHGSQVAVIEDSTLALSSQETTMSRPDNNASELVLVARQNDTLLDGDESLSEQEEMDRLGDIVDDSTIMLTVTGNAQFIAEGTIQLGDSEEDRIDVDGDALFETTFAGNIFVGVDNDTSETFDISDPSRGTDSGAMVDFGGIQFVAQNQLRTLFGHVTILQDASSDSPMTLVGESIAQTVVLESTASITDAAREIDGIQVGTSLQINAGALSAEDQFHEFAKLIAAQDIVLGDDSSEAESTFRFANVDPTDGVNQFLSLSAVNAFIALDSDVNLASSDAENDRIPFTVSDTLVISATGDVVQIGKERLDSGGFTGTIIAPHAVISGSSVFLDRTDFDTFAGQLVGSTNVDDITALDSDLRDRLPRATPYDTTQLLPLDQSPLTQESNRVDESFEENPFDQIVRIPSDDQIVGDPSDDEIVRGPSDGITINTFLYDDAIDQYDESVDDNNIVEPPRLNEFKDYALVLSNLGDLTVSWIVHPHQLGDTKGINSLSGHVYIEALDQTNQESSTDLRDEADNGDIWFVGFAGDLEDISDPESHVEGDRHVVVDINVDYVFTAVADNQLVIESQRRPEDVKSMVNRTEPLECPEDSDCPECPEDPHAPQATEPRPYATLRSTLRSEPDTMPSESSGQTNSGLVIAGRVTDVEPFFTFDDRSPDPVVIDGPMLVLTPPEEDRSVPNPATSRYVVVVDPIEGIENPQYDHLIHVPQNIQFTVGSVSEQNLTLVFAWADFDMGQFETETFRGTIPSEAEQTRIRDIIDGENQSGLNFNRQNVVVLSDDIVNDEPIGLQNFTNIFIYDFIANNPIAPNLPTSIFLFNDPRINLFERAMDGEPQQLNETRVTIGGVPEVETDGSVFVNAIADVVQPAVQLAPVVDEPIVFDQPRVFVVDTPIITIPEVREFDDVRPFVIYLPRVIYGAVVNNTEEWLDEEEFLKEKDVEPGQENVIDEVKTEIDNNNWPQGDYLIIEYDSNGQMINKSRHFKDPTDDDNDTPPDDEFGGLPKGFEPVPVAFEINILPYWQRAASHNTQIRSNDHLPRNNAHRERSPTSHILPSSDESKETENSRESQRLNSDKPISQTAASLGGAILLSKLACLRGRKDESNKTFSQMSSGHFSPSQRRRRKIRSKYRH